MRKRTASVAAAAIFIPAALASLLLAQPASAAVPASTGQTAVRAELDRPTPPNAPHLPDRPTPPNAPHLPDRPGTPPTGPS
ncbi:hypothetical protein SAMN05421805_10687 [Saccharopolyspora antimicrobica]|uniref:Uncharacterized protein n=1 Tax=Saccharopolyspora antimicrobica TaxID=455193 RepID=A0A1I5B1W4_9PSEU|nr:hypothetical protein [Saccharopolyspora antimicrobica]RKT86441.1 hypothetical protein ATL45_4815 [Saccharopolyspora antimicrobica]SFN68718.1 hypothetical protein SAMN05421805_10687 [Saccharopolyspora antimicrobica]